MRFVLDTNAIIELLKSASTPLAIAARQHAPSDIGLSAIVAHELYFGACKSVRRDHNLARVDALRFEILPFDKEDAMASGAVRAALGGLGTPIGPYDVLIAGQALCRGLTLVTANTREFARVAGLRIVDWSR
jgi:tRNA(fMet)-specific endonuclease VapC